VRVAEATAYSSFKEMLEEETLEAVLPGVQSLAEGVTGSARESDRLRKVRAHVDNNSSFGCGNRLGTGIVIHQRWLLSSSMCDVDVF
jgi:hypothetical protein